MTRLHVAATIATLISILLSPAYAGADTVKYYKSEDTMRFSQAKEYRMSKGDHLVIIRSKAENDAAYSACIEGEKEASCWLGLTEHEEDQSFWWVDGSQADYTYWDTNEGTSASGLGEIHAAFFSQWHDDKWADISQGGFSTYALCEHRSQEKLMLGIAKNMQGRIDHLFYRKDEATAIRDLTTAFQKHGQNQDGVIEELKRLAGTDHFIYRWSKDKAVTALDRAIYENGGIDGLLAVVCESMKDQMVVIRSKAEDDAAYSACNDDGEDGEQGKSYCWLGLSHRKEDKSWWWTDDQGPKADYTRWDGSDIQEYSGCCQISIYALCEREIENKEPAPSEETWNNPPDDLETVHWMDAKASSGLFVSATLIAATFLF